MSNVTITGIKAEPNSKTCGFLDVGEPEYSIPFVIINGANKGKTIAVLGGVHGTEHPGVEAVIRLTQKLDPAQLSGTLIATPIVNIPQFLGHSQFTSPVDGLNLNSEFPGDPKGSLTQRIAHKVFTEIVPKCDALIDCHGGDVDEDINGFVIASSSRDPVLDRVSLEMASCYDTGLVHVFPSEKKGMSNSAQRIYGIPCIQPEAGTPFPVKEKAVQFHVDGVVNVLRYFQMLPGEPERHHQQISPRRLKLFSEHNGIWESNCKLDQRVQKGETLGVVKNYFGDTIQIIHAPEAGIVSMMRCYYAVKLKELLLVVSTLS